MKKTILLLLLLSILLSYSVSAQHIIDEKFMFGDELVINDTKPDNLYAVGGSLQILQNVNGDLNAVGGEILIDGRIFEDVSVIGGDIRINGDVGGDVRAAGGNIILNATVFGDFVAIGGSIILDEGNIVGKDVVLSGGSIIVESTVSNNLAVAGGDVVINGIVRGDTEIDAGSLILGENALLLGDLITTKEFDIDESKVSGKITVNPELTVKKKPKIGFWGVLIFFIYLFIGGLLMWLLAGKYTEKSSILVLRNPITTFFLGLATFIIMPILGFILLVSIIAFPLGILIFMLYGLLLMLGLIVGAIMIGKLVYKLFNSKPPKILGLLVGAAVFSLVMMVPVVGALVLLYFCITGMGALVRAPFSKRKVSSRVTTKRTPAKKAKKKPGKSKKDKHRQLKL